jgi:hypothetical protein
MNEIKIEVSSDLDYEKMVVNLLIDNNHFATLNCDKGSHNTEIQILDRFEEKVVWTLNYNDFIHALHHAYEKLTEINK